MKATIESTSAIVDMRDHLGQPYRARVWHGVTETGVELTLYIAGTQVARSANQAEFIRDLMDSGEPNAATQRAIDMRFII